MVLTEEATSAGAAIGFLLDLSPGALFHLSIQHIHPLTSSASIGLGIYPLRAATTTTYRTTIPLAMDSNELSALESPIPPAMESILRFLAFVFYVLLLGDEEFRDAITTRLHKHPELRYFWYLIHAYMTWDIFMSIFRTAERLGWTDFLHGPTCRCPIHNAQRRNEREQLLRTTVNVILNIDGVS